MVNLEENEDGVLSGFEDLGTAASASGSRSSSSRRDGASRPEDPAFGPKAKT